MSAEGPVLMGDEAYDAILKHATLESAKDHLVQLLGLTKRLQEENATLHGQTDAYVDAIRQLNTQLVGARNDVDVLRSTALVVSENLAGPEGGNAARAVRMLAEALACVATRGRPTPTAGTGDEAIESILKIGAIETVEEHLTRIRGLAKRLYEENADLSDQLEADVDAMNHLRAALSGMRKDIDLLSLAGHLALGHLKSMLGSANAEAASLVSSVSPAEAADLLDKTLARVTTPRYSPIEIPFREACRVVVEKLEKDTRELVLPKTGPDLAWIAAKLRAAFLERP